MTVRTTPTVGPFTTEWLVELGFDELPPEACAELLDHLCDELQLRVGAELARQLTAIQLGEVEEIMERQDEDAVLVWLEASLPSYRDAIAHERRQLEAELRSGAPKFMAALRTVGR